MSPDQPTPSENTIQPIQKSMIEMVEGVKMKIQQLLLMGINIQS